MSKDIKSIPTIVNCLLHYESYIQSCCRIAISSLFTHYWNLVEIDLSFSLRGKVGDLLCFILSYLLNGQYLYWLFNPYHPSPGRREKIKLDFYFHTSLWCLERFYEGLKGLHKTFWGTTKKCEKKKINLIFISIQLSEMHWTGRVKVCLNWWFTELLL